MCLGLLDIVRDILLENVDPKDPQDIDNSSSKGTTLERRLPQFALSVLDPYVNLP